MEYATIRLLLVPAIFAVGGSVLAIVGAGIGTPAPSRSGMPRAILGIIGLAFLALAGWGLRAWPHTNLADLSKLTADPLALYTTLIALIGAILALLVAFQQPHADSIGEFFAMIFFTAAGLIMVGLASDLIILLLAIELSSIPSYVLVGLSRRHALAEEAGAKYFFLGALATALMAYGFIFLYGAAGTMNLSVPMTGQADNVVRWLTAVGLILAFAGLAFKITAIPFYFYAPDVYQGTAGSVTAIIAFLPKVAGFIAIIRLMAFVGFTSDVWNIFWPILWIVAAGTATAGNVLALLQHDVKRILAYSSVAHSGYMLIGLAAAVGLPGGLQSGLAAVLFYAFIYGLMSLGSFGVLGFLANTRKIPAGSSSTDADEPSALIDLTGLATVRAGSAFLLAIFLISLTGLPPTAGFWAKVYVFTAALSSANFWLILLVVIGLLNAAVSAAYYFRIIGWLYMHPMGPIYAERAEDTTGAWIIVSLGLILTAAFLIYLGIAPGRLMQVCETAAAALAVH